MLKVAYKVVAEGRELPHIERVEITDLEGVSWREAKKQLRKFYLYKAAELRGLTEEIAFPTERLQ